MIFIDTSIWINYFKGDSNIVSQLNKLLDADNVHLPYPVLLEIFSGSRKQEQSKLQRIFSALPIYSVTSMHWDLCYSWITLAKKAGDQFTIVDMLIAAIVSENNGLSWTLDKDFKRMDSLKMVTTLKI
jgi:predicted nucleic acid-binding protein